MRRRFHRGLVRPAVALLGVAVLVQGASPPPPAHDRRDGVQPAFAIVQDDRVNGRSPLTGELRDLEGTWAATAFLVQVPGQRQCGALTNYHVQFGYDCAPKPRVGTVLTLTEVAGQPSFRAMPRAWGAFCDAVDKPNPMHRRTAEDWAYLELDGCDPQAVAGFVPLSMDRATIERMGAAFEGLGYSSGRQKRDPGVRIYALATATQTGGWLSNATSFPGDSGGPIYLPADGTEAARAVAINKGVNPKVFQLCAALGRAYDGVLPSFTRDCATLLVPITPEMIGAITQAIAPAP